MPEPKRIEVYLDDVEELGVLISAVNLQMMQQAKNAHERRLKATLSRVRGKLIAIWRALRQRGEPNA